MNVQLKHTPLKGFTVEEDAQLLGACDRVWNAIGYDLADAGVISNSAIVDSILDGGCFDMYAELPQPLLDRFHDADYATRRRWLKRNRRYN